MYPDAAHKPEMVISLAGFCGFAGFLSPDHMAQALQDYPQLNEVLGAKHVLQFLQAAQAQDTSQRQLVSATVRCLQCTAVQWTYKGPGALGSILQKMWQCHP
jgi:mannose-6-phosphate isomerase class I